MTHPIQRLRNAAETEEIDYILIKNCLKDYAAPRDIVTRLLRTGDLIRIKKGLYVFGPHYAKRPYSLEILSNLIYGPSYLSCEYALSFYGLIPEAVFELTSMTTQRNKLFNTPVGRFRYKYLHLTKYIVGITQVKIAPNLNVIMATPEKALADCLFIQNENINDLKALTSILYDGYRLDPSEIAKLDMHLMLQIAQAYQKKTIQLLPDVIKEAKRYV